MTLSGLTQNVTYFVNVYAYNGNGYTAAFGAPASANVKTPIDNATGVTAGPTAEPATLSSITNISPGDFVFDITITDDSEGGGDDNLPTLISQMVFNPQLGNDIPDWTEYNCRSHHNRRY